MIRWLLASLFVCTLGLLAACGDSAEPPAPSTGGPATVTPTPPLESATSPSAPPPPTATPTPSSAASPSPSLSATATATRSSPTPGITPAATPAPSASPPAQSNADPVLAAYIAVATADLAARLAIPLSAITVVEAAFFTWNDSSMGCPKPGMVYAQSLQAGALVRLEAGGRTYPYHVGPDGLPFLCESRIS